MTEPVEVTAYTAWEWDCPCGYRNTEDHDPADEDVECADCGDAARVVHTH